MEEIRRFTRIEGNTVVSLRETIERRVPLDEFIEGLTKNATLVAPLLPANCVAYARHGVDDTVSSLFIVEQLAGDFSFKYALPDDAPREPDESDAQFDERRKNTIYKLSMPYLYWAHKFSNDKFAGVYPFATRAPLRLYNDATRIYRVPLPNIYPDGKVCVGDALAMNISDPVHKRVEAVMQHLADSYWNSDLQIDLDELGVNSYKEWNRRSYEQRIAAQTAMLPGHDVQLPVWTALKLSAYSCGNKGEVPQFYGQFLAKLLGNEWPEINPSPDQVYPVVQRGS